MPGTNLVPRAFPLAIWHPARAKSPREKPWERGWPGTLPLTFVSVSLLESQQVVYSLTHGISALTQWLQKKQ